MIASENEASRHLFLYEEGNSIRPAVFDFPTGWNWPTGFSWSGQLYAPTKWVDFFNHLEDATRQIIGFELTFMEVERLLECWSKFENVNRWCDDLQIVCSRPRPGAWLESDGWLAVGAPVYAHRDEHFIVLLGFCPGIRERLAFPVESVDIPQAHFAEQPARQA